MKSVSTNQHRLPTGLRDKGLCTTKNNNIPPKFYKSNTGYDILLRANSLKKIYSTPPPASPLAAYKKEGYLAFKTGQFKFRSRSSINLSNKTHNFSNNSTPTHNFRMNKVFQNHNSRPYVSSFTNVVTMKKQDLANQNIQNTTLPGKLSFIIL